MVSSSPSRTADDSKVSKLASSSIGKTFSQTSGNNEKDLYIPSRPASAKPEP